MTTVFAQSAFEYGGAAGSIISVIADQFNTIVNTVRISVSDHPVLWGAGVCVAAWVLIRRR